MPRKLRVLFLCVGNSCRSQMAEALAKHIASSLLEVESAGISPLGRIAEATRRTLLERGVEMNGQYSKGVTELQMQSVDVIVNLTGIPGRSLYPSREVLDWDVDDPYGEDAEIYRQVCDDIEFRLRSWIDSLAADDNPGASGAP